MGADNWRNCPQCIKNCRDAHEAQRKALEDKYGKIPKAEYEGEQKKLVELSLKLDKKDFCTLPEYIDIRICEDGEFVVYYGATCTVCGFSFSYDFKQQVELK